VRVRILLFLTASLAVVGPSAIAEIGFQADPVISRLDQPVSVTLNGLPPEASVIVRAETTDILGRRWGSDATFRADPDGKIDTLQQSPQAGTYRGIDGMGLFWSMTLPRDEPRQTAFLHTTVKPITVDLQATLPDGSVRTLTITRLVADPSLVRREVNAPGVQGTLFSPPDDGSPRPAVIVLGGSEGGIPAESYVAQFANAGFVSFGLAWFGTKDLTEHLANVPVETFASAVRWLREQPGVDPGKIGIVGTSIGGVAALLAAAENPEIGAVVSFNGGGLIFQSIDPDPTARVREQSTFSRGGVPLPFLPIASVPMTNESLQTAYYLRVFLGAYFAADARAISAATVPVEKIQGPVLMIAGQSDRLLGSATMSELAFERLCKSDFKPRFQLLAYSGAGHNLGATGLPGTPATLTQELIGPNQIPYSFGGSPRQIESARQDSWKSAIEWLHSALPLPPPPTPAPTATPSPSPTPKPKNSPRPKTPQKPKPASSRG